MKHFAITTLAALGALLAAAPGALANDVTCAGTYPSFTMIDGNLVVPNNINCDFEGGVQVTGNVTVGNGAGLVIASPDTGDTSIIAGNLQAVNCSYVELNYGGLYKTVIGGNVQILNCTGKGNPHFTGEAFGDRGSSGTIMGDFQCLDNSGACVLAYATVGGNVQLYNNVSALGTPSQVFDITNMKDLQCQNNSPTPTGGGNTIVGNPGQSSEGQCTGF